MSDFTIRNPLLQRGESTTELSATVDDFKLWYTVPADWPAELHGDPFVIAALLPAMLHSRDIVLPDDLSVSEGVLERLERLQQIFTSWGPTFGVAFKPVRVTARVAQAPSAIPGTGSFFSGGVDGTYTFLKNLHEITHAIFLKGIDMQVDNDDLYTQALNANRGFVEGHGVQVLPAATNVRFFGRHFGLSWNHYLGAGLSSMAAVIRLQRVLIAAGHTWADLRPNGTHPVTDPLWSSGATRIVRDGEEASRSEKLAAIARDPAALSLLRVCWQDKGYNCGECEKCLRTMTALELLGLQGEHFPPFPGPAVVRRQVIHDQGGLEFALDLHELAVQRRRDDIASALDSSIRRYQAKRGLVELDRQLLGGRLKRMISRGR